MVTRAYPEFYVKNAMVTMATMLDYAVTCQREPIDYFFQCFINTGVARQFEIGNPDVIVGRSGVELYHMVKCNYYINMQGYTSFDRSPVFWLGWSLAYYQWYKGISFAEIVHDVPLNEMLMWYNTLHEADIMRFVDAVDERIFQKKQMGTWPSVPPYYTSFDYVPFQNRLVESIVEENRRIALLNAWQQQTAIYCNSCRYDYINQFPYQNMALQSQGYLIEQTPYLDNWNSYWSKTVNQPVDMRLMEETARKALGEAITLTGNETLAITYNLYSVITADNLLKAIDSILNLVRELMS